MVMEVLRNGTVSDQFADTEVPVSFYQPAETIVINDLTYDPDTDKRPLGWTELRTKRVILKERAERKMGVSEVQILERRTQRELEVYSIITCLLCEIPQSNYVLECLCRRKQL
jgi:hypothetical protein